MAEVSAKLHKNCPENQRPTVSWSDDSMTDDCEILRSNVHHYQWRKSGESHSSECLQPFYRFWADFSQKRDGKNRVRIDGTQKSIMIFDPPC